MASIRLLCWGIVRYGTKGEILYASTNDAQSSFMFADEKERKNSKITAYIADTEFWRGCENITIENAKSIFHGVKGICNTIIRPKVWEEMMASVDNADGKYAIGWDCPQWPGNIVLNY